MAAVIDVSVSACTEPAVGRSMTLAHLSLHAIKIGPICLYAGFFHSARGRNKDAIILLPLTLPFTDRFFKFFHQ